MHLCERRQVGSNAAAGGEVLISGKQNDVDSSRANGASLCCRRPEVVGKCIRRGFGEVGDRAGERVTDCGSLSRVDQEVTDDGDTDKGVTAGRSGTSGKGW